MTGGVDLEPSPVTKAVAVGVILRKGKVLLTRRPVHSPWGGFWEFPGGKRQPGETLRQTVIRECHEECNIVVDPVHVIDVAVHDEGNTSLLVAYYLCHHHDGEVLHRAVTDHVWCEPKNVGAYPMPPANRSLQSWLSQGNDPSTPVLDPAGGRR